ncbi:hypothetical protein Fcan01_11537 [Folsomia candida]|uniref:Uncharacterized protein n=1 Tax=Folsomia candida TaxID=158441 RepID=A0A226EA94_FOLCA|nr:hypothetical protein Fcan01_11537 [Folsomia candida]
MTTYLEHILAIVLSNPFSPRVLDHIENSVISNNSSPTYPFHSRFETRLATFILPPDKKYLNLAFQAHQLLNVLRRSISSNEDPTCIFINIFYTTLLSHFPPDIAPTSKFLILPTCTKEVIAKRYNFSNYIYPRDLRGRTILPTVNVMIVLTPIFDMLADKQFNENVFRPRSPHKNAWYVHGTHYLPFLFVVIAPKVKLSFETIIAPFDSATWVSIIILAASGSIIILLTPLTSSRTTFSTNFSNAAFSKISTIFGQTDSTRLQPSRRNRILLPGLLYLITPLITEIEVISN